MSKTPVKPVNMAPKAKSIREVLEEIKAEILKLEASSSHGDFRQACRDCVVVLDKYMGTP